MFQATADAAKISVSTAMVVTVALVTTSGNTAKHRQDDQGPAGRQPAAPGAARLPPAAAGAVAHWALAARPAEQAGRAEHQHQHQRHVEHHDRPVRRPDVHQGLGRGHEHRRRQRAADAAQPAEDDDREQPGDQVVAAVGVEAPAGGAEHHAAHRGDRHPDPERHRGHPVHVDPDQPGRDLVLHGGAHAAAEPGPVQHAGRAPPRRPRRARTRTGRCTAGRSRTRARSR